MLSVSMRAVMSGADDRDPRRAAPLSERTPLRTRLASVLLLAVLALTPFETASAATADSILANKKQEGVRPTGYCPRRSRCSNGYWEVYMKRADGFCRWVSRGGRCRAGSLQPWRPWRR